MNIPLYFKNFSDLVKKYNNNYVYHGIRSSLHIPREAFCLQTSGKTA